MIIALGESITIVGANSHRQAGASATGALAIAFAQIAALWWLYFGEVAIHSRAQMRASEDPLELARDAYSYLHLPIIGGVILSAVGANYLTASPGRTLSGAQAAVTLAGPALYLLGELLFRIRMIGRVNHKRITAIVLLALLGTVATAVSAAVLGALELAVLVALGLWEYEPLQYRGGRSVTNRRLLARLLPQDESEPAGAVITVSRRGPYVVSGGLALSELSVLRDSDAHVWDWSTGAKLHTGERFALCRCGFSATKPSVTPHATRQFDGAETAPREPREASAEIVAGPAFSLSDAPALCAMAGVCEARGGIRAALAHSDEPQARRDGRARGDLLPSGRLVLHGVRHRDQQR